MKVRFTKDTPVNYEVQEKGSVVDVPDEVASALIAGGYATKARGVERAAVDAPERAVSQRGKARK